MQTVICRPMFACVVEANARVLPKGMPGLARTRLCSGNRLMLLRSLILLVGPMLLIAGSYCLTIGRTHIAQETASTASTTTRNLDRFDVDALRAGAEAGLSTSTARSDDGGQARLALLCDERARQLRGKLLSTDRIIVRPPFVIAGDCTEAVLDRIYTQTILPTSRALRLAFFDKDPDEPVSILLFSSDHTYRDASVKFDKRSSGHFYGYYVRPERRILLNVSTGEGTLAHELTHALAHFDFPDMPEWFDEGFASLFEEASFTEDELMLVGSSNWRLNHLLHAMKNRKLRALEELITGRKVRSEHQAVDYAQARYFCLYLQNRGLLPFFYRRFRLNIDSDPAGLKTLCEVFNTSSLDEIDRDFRQWAIDLYQQEHLAARAATP